jgi:hypothetical protein
MDGVTANQVEEKQWYVAVGERSLGPLPTNLVTRGIRSGKVPSTAWVCQVGDSGWSALSSFIEFQEALERATSAEFGSAPVSDVAQRAHLPYELDGDSSRTNHGDAETGPSEVFPGAYASGSESRASQGSFSDVSGQREVDPALRREVALAFEQQQSLASEPTPTRAGGDVQLAAHPGGEDDALGIDITFDEHEPAVDWNVRFHSYFLVGSDVELPEEEQLLKSLHAAPKSTFLHDEALWNLALCLAFGSDVVASETASTFFRSVAIASEHTVERLEWMCRTLLSKGFMPSGIPRVEGNRGIDVLRQHCPAELVALFERQVSA